MRRIYLTSCLGKALVVWGACCLTGCQQFHLNSPPSFQKKPSDAPQTADGNLSAAQQADIQIAMGRVNERQGDFAGAMTAYREAVKRDSRRADAYARMAILHDKQGEFREAAELYRQALKLSPGSPDIYCDMGYSLYLQRRWAESEMNLRQAIAFDGKHARAHNNLAMLLARDGRLIDALEEFRKAGNDPASAHANLGFVLSTDRRWDEARTQYELAVAADPSSQELKDRLAQLDTLVAKVGSSRDANRRKQDTRLVMASRTDVRSRAMPASPVQAGSPSRTDARSRAMPASPVQAGSPPRTVARSNAKRTRQVPADTGSATVANFETERAAHNRAVAQRQTSAASALPASIEAAEKRPVAAPGRGPSVAASRAETPRMPETGERVSVKRPRKPVPPPKPFQVPGDAHPESKQPARSERAIPPPRVRVAPPNSRETDDSAELPSITPLLSITAPKTG
jgi:Tfp pilus assembly protein PilF